MPQKRLLRVNPHFLTTRMWIYWLSGLPQPVNTENIAESEGFEPPDRSTRSMVFKTTSIDHSDNSPNHGKRVVVFQKPKFEVVTLRLAVCFPLVEVSGLEPKMT